MYQCDCITSLCPLLNLSAYCPSRHIPVVCVPLSITGGLCSNSKNTLNFRNMSFNNMRSFTKTTEYGNLTHSYLCSCKYSLGLFKRWRNLSTTLFFPTPCSKQIQYLDIIQMYIFKSYKDRKDNFPKLSKHSPYSFVGKYNFNLFQKILNTYWLYVFYFIHISKILTCLTRNNQK